MLISELKPNQPVDSITVEIVDIGQTKEFTNFRGKVRVTNAKVKDSTGQCTLTLWNDEVDKYSNGQKVRVINGWCKEYRGELQLSSGKYGRIEPAGQGEAAEAKENIAEEKPVQKTPRRKKAKKPAKEDVEEEIQDENENTGEDFFSEAENDPYIKYEKKYGKKLV